MMQNIMRNRIQEKKWELSYVNAASLIQGITGEITLMTSE